MQPALLFQTARQLGVRQGVEQTDHRHRNRGVLDQFHHGVGDRNLLGVEADDKAGGDKHSRGIELWTLSARLRRVFCFFLACTNVSGSGLSMPTKTAKKFAFRISCSKS